MSSTISVTVGNEINVVQTFSTAEASDQTATFNSSSSTDAYTASTSVPVTKHAKYTLTLSSGSGTIDLTSLPGITANETVDGTGLKLQKMRLANPSANANKISVTNGASNGYRTDGATTNSLTVALAPGQSVLLEFDEAADDVGSSHKTFDVTGTGSQTLSVHVVLG